MNQSEERIRKRILQDEIKRLGSLLRQEEAAHLATKGNVRFIVTLGPTLLGVIEQVLTGASFNRTKKDSKIRNQNLEQNWIQILKQKRPK